MATQRVFVVMCLVAFSATIVNGIPIDNGVQGDPEVECLATSISINFNTKNPFEGRVFVKNHFSEGAGCVSPAAGGGNLATINLPFDACGVQRRRSAEPRGVFVTTTVIISFHPTFITKIDRAFKIQCFYMEADKTVSQELEASMLTTGVATMNVPMPTCRYDILDNGPDGAPVKFVTIGQQVYHKWICDTDTKDAFCMVVYDCKVNDGSGDSIQLLDNDGCALDKHLLNNLDYQTNLMAGQEAHVFKYADRPNLYFNCQIRITVKDPGVDCARPTCSPLARVRRSAEQKRAEIPGEVIVDVATEHPILVADLDFTENDLPSSLLHPRLPRRRVAGRAISAVDPSSRQAAPSNQGVCMSPFALGVGIFIGAVLTVALVSISLTSYYRKVQ